MRNYVFGGIAILCVVVAAVLVIRSESAKMRETVREAAREGRQELVRDAAREGVEGAIEGVRRGTERVSEAIGDVLGESSDKTTDSIDEPQPVKPQDRNDKATEAKDNTKPFKPDDVVSDVFDVLHKASKAGDDIGQQVLGLDVEEENAWGAKFDDAMREQSKVVDDPAALERIERLAAPLVRQCRRHEIKYTFAVLDDPRINACSILGGHVYVNQGLLEFVAGDAELQSVLGHEIGHVELRHCVRRTSYAVRASQLATVTAANVASMLYGLISTGYSEDDEFAADEWGARAMMSTGRSQEEILSCTRRFNKFLTEHGIETGGGTKTDSLAGAVDRAIGDHFRTHPPGEERLRRLELVTMKNN